MISVVIPAAGLSTRMGDANKLLLDIDGEAMIKRVVRRALSLHVGPVVVVTGHEARDVQRVLGGLDVTLVMNSEFELGMGSSLRVGVRATQPPDGMLIWPADMPLIRLDTARGICNTYSRDTITVPVYEGRKGHPVLFGAGFRDALLAIAPETGARSVLAKFDHSIHQIEVDDAGILLDIDTPADWKNL